MRPPVEIQALQSARRLIGAKVRAFSDASGKAFPDRAFVPPVQAGWDSLRVDDCMRSDQPLPGQSDESKLPQ
jgi:hypothetical protein